jgi:hypothetical protein
LRWCRTLIAGAVPALLPFEASRPQSKSPG